MTGVQTCALPIYGLRSPLTIGFKDDVSLEGSLSTVSSDINLFRREGAKLGLQLKVGKLEVISKALFKHEGFLASFCPMPFFWVLH